MVHVATESTIDVDPGNQITVRAWLRTDAIEVSIVNGGSSPIDVLWDKASIVDLDGSVSAVVHNGLKEAGPPSDLPGDVSRIAPSSVLNDLIVPAEKFGFDKDYGWLVEPLLPIECGPLRCVGYHELVGKSVGLRLVMQVDGAEYVYESTLRITNAVRSSRGTRPDDPNLH